MKATSRPEAGWYRDPSGRHEHRWWNGSEWTQYVISLGLRSVDYGDDPRGNGSEASPAPTRAEEVVDAAATTVAAPWRWPLGVWCTVLIGAALLVLGAVLPWAEASSK